MESFASRNSTCCQHISDKRRKTDDDDHYFHSDVEDDDDDDEDENVDQDDEDDDEEEDDSDVYVAYGEEPWREAVESGNVQQLKDLIQERGIDILARNCVIAGEDMTTALIVAVRNNHLAIVKYLLEHCRSVVRLNALEWMHARVYASWTALHFAALHNAKMVRYLISQGMDVNINPNRGNCRTTALYVAARNNRSKAFRCLLETPGCNVDATFGDETEDDDASVEYGEDNDNGSLLSIIIRNNNLSMVQSLMDHYSKANAERAKSEAQVALHIACGMDIGGLEIVQYLVETFQIDLESILHDDNEVDNDDDEEEEEDDDEMYVDTKATPLLKACQSGNLDIIQFLVSRGAKMDAKDKDGDSVLHLPVNRSDIVQYFVETHGIDVEQPNHKGSTVLHYACRRGSVATVRYLVQARNANVNAVNSDGETPLHMASRKGCLEAARCIVKSGRCKTINAQDDDGQTPLHVSCANHDMRFAMTRYWVDTARADVSVVDNDGNTPLHTVAASGRCGRRTVLFLVTRMSVEDFEDEPVSVGPGLSKRQKVQ